jgi:hypothetical protein
MLRAVIRQESLATHSGAEALMDTLYLLRAGIAILALLTASPRVEPQATAAPLTKPEIEHFLSTAKVVAQKSIPKGVTSPIRVTLSDGTLRHDAAFSAVDERTPVMTFANGRTELDFVDSYKYTIAAYRLAESLGLDGMMPVTVERRWAQRTGSLSWWVDVKWDEAQRLKQRLEPPDAEAWNRQMHRMRVFTALVADTDRNLGNVLISADWSLWMIDFTRAFRRSHQLLAPENLTRCDRKLLDDLRALKDEDVAARTTPYLGRAEVRAMMARRDLIVALFEKRVAQKGAAVVLY